jgi:hypothetical protein
MKDIKNLLLLVLLALVVTRTHGQDIGNWGRSYEPTPDKSDSYYNRQANRLEKDGNLLAAVSNAALALKLADKKRQIRRAQETLNNSYAKALEVSTEEVKSLKEGFNTTEGGEKVLAASSIASTYKTLSGTMEVLKEIPKDKLKMRKVGMLSFQFMDLSTKIEEANSDLSNAIDDAAAYYHRIGYELMTHADTAFAADTTVDASLGIPDLSHEDRMLKIKTYKDASKSFRKSMKFRPDYKDAAEKHSLAKDRGTTRIVTMAFEEGYNKSTYDGNLGPRVGDLVAVSLKKKNYEFIEVTSKAIEGIRFVEASGPEENTLDYLMQNHDGAHVALIGVLTNIQVERNRAKPEVDKVERKIVVNKETYTDSDGNEKVREIKGTVRAIFTKYSKSMEVTISGRYQIVSLIDGQVLKSGDILGKDTFYFEWGKFSGDERALSSYLRSLAGMEESDYPKIAHMALDASNNLSRNIADDVESQYVAIVGK